MKHTFYMAGIGLLCLLASCGKKGSPAPTPQPDQEPKTVGNTTTYPNGYVVKTIGVSHINLAVDANYKLSLATLYGGGNRVILKAGSGFKMDNQIRGGGTDPDNVTNKPDAVIDYLDQDIDNGQLLDTTGAQGSVIKLTGFDKSRTGYNQLNIVMAKFLWPAAVTGGFYSNLVYLDFTKQAGKKNADYGGSFINQLFRGDIQVAGVEIAPPVAQKNYVVEDHLFGYGQATYDKNMTYNIKLADFIFQFNASYTVSGSSPGLPTTPNIKFKWVNADKATVTASDAYTYSAVFDNIKAGGNLLQVVEPADTVSKAFLRISGFDRTQYGFNELRMFPANEGYYNGGLQIFYVTKQTKAPSINDVKSVYTPTGLYGLGASPNWPHF